MQLEIERNRLLAAINAVDATVPSRTTIPILTHARLAANGELAIEGTNLEAWMTVTTPAAVSAPGTTTVPAGALKDIAKTLPDGAQVRLELENGRCRITSGRSRFTLPTLPPADYPVAPPLEPTHETRIPAKTLARLLATVRHAIGQDASRTYLGGACIRSGSGRDGRVALIVEATDAHRLARRAIDLPEGIEVLPPVIVPHPAVVTLLKLAESAEARAEEEEEAEIRLDDRRLEAKLGARIYSTALVDGTWPDTDRVIPQRNVARITADRQELINAITRCLSISASNKTGIGFSVQDGELILTHRSGDGLSDATDAIRVDEEGEPHEFGISPRYLLDALGVLSTEMVTLVLHGPGSPITILSEREDPDVLLLVMPMRL